MMTAEAGSTSMVRLASAGFMTAPTPLEFLANLSRELGIEVWAKRDDVHPLGLGGNKVRKLDLILGRALIEGVDTVITYGGVQSNQCRLTAAAAARLGLSCTVVLSGAEPATASGNLLLDYLFGAEVLFFPSDTPAAAAAETEAQRLRSRGARTLVIGLGGSDALGTAAYFLAVEELEAQCRAVGLEPKDMFVTAGSCGTVAGIAAGAAHVMPDARVTGVNVAALSTDGTELPVLKLARQAERLLGRPPRVTAVRILDEFSGGAYGAPTTDGRRAIHELAAKEGLLLDPTYTAKTMSAMLATARSGECRGPLVFWHTGGAPALFAHDPADLLQHD